LHQLIVLRPRLSFGVLVQVGVPAVLWLCACLPPSAFPASWRVVPPNADGAYLHFSELVQLLSGLLAIALVALIAVIAAVRSVLQPSFRPRGVAVALGLLMLVGAAGVRIALAQ
jgi:hypothetical protein